MKHGYASQNSPLKSCKKRKNAKDSHSVEQLAMDLFRAAVGDGNFEEFEKI